jgi:hypothetical protein
MTEDIIGATLKEDSRMVLRPPPVEHIMEQEMGQHGRTHSPLRRPLLSGLQGAVFEVHGGLKPPLDIEQPPPTGGMLSHRAEEQVLRDGIERAPKLIPPSRTQRKGNRPKSK